MLFRSMAAAQSQLDLMLRLATLSLLYGIIWSIVVALKTHWGLLWGTVPALPLSLMFWLSAHSAAVSYGGLLRSAFDLFRFAVYEQMRWPLPKSPKKEKAHGEAFILYLTSGHIKDKTAYTKTSGDTTPQK